MVYGVPPTEAPAIVLVDRAISVLSIIVLGAIAYVVSPMRRGTGRIPQPGAAERDDRVDRYRSPAAGARLSWPAAGRPFGGAPASREPIRDRGRTKVRGPSARGPRPDSPHRTGPPTPT